MNKVLFVTGCPRSGTSFYGMYVLENIDGFYVGPENYEPSLLHDAQYDFLNKQINKVKLKKTFVEFVEKQNIKKDKWVVIKQPYFSFILDCLCEMPFEKKILITKRDDSEILTSRMNYKDSISQVTGSFESTWLYLYGVKGIQKEWEYGSYEKRMSIYIREQQNIEKVYYNKCLTINYGENIAENEMFQKELGLTVEQIKQLNENFVRLWKNQDYETLRNINKKEAEEYKKEKNI